MTNVDKFILIATLAAAIIIVLVALAIDGKHARQVCEASHSAATCTHILR